MRLLRRAPGTAAPRAEAPTEVQTETIEEAGPPGPPVPPPGDRDLWPWLLVLLVLVLGGLLAAWLITRDDNNKAQTTAPVTTVVTTVAPTTTQTATTPQGPRVTLANLLGIPVTTATKRLQRDGLRWRIRRVDSPKPAGIVAGQAPGPGTQLAKGDTVRLDVSKGPPAVAVPALVGLSRQRAVAALERIGLKTNAVVVASNEPAGQVIAQNPRAGTKAKRGAAVRLNVSNGAASSPQPAPPPPPTATTTTPATTAATPTPPPPTTTPASARRVQIPDVVGLKLRAARKQIRAAGLVTEIKYVPSSQPEGTVVSQFPKAGKTVPRGEHVLVNVSLGAKPKPQVTVPNVVGQDEASARSALQNAGFVVDVADVPTDDPAQNGIVVDEQPPAGSQAPRGSDVTIYVARSG